MKMMKIRCAGGVFALCITASAFASPLFQDVKAGWHSSEAYLIDRNGEVLHQLRLDPNVRRLDWISLNDISPALRKAVLHAEDRHFNEHDGVDWLALGAAALSNLTGKGKRGASTVTMQVAAMLDSSLSPKNGKRSLSQKWDQITAAQEFDRSWTKDEIMEAYFNLATFRGELQGIASASHSLFGKSPSGLTETEAVLLAALLPAPNAPAVRVAGRACALGAVLSIGENCASLRQLAQTALNGGGIKMDAAWAPHAAQNLLHAPGDRVRSTLDGRLQRFATETLQRHLHDLADRNVYDGAVLILDNASGEVLAYVGNAGVLSSARFVDGVRALRQAGSTLKPFLYGVAIEERILTAASLVEDTPVMLPTANGLYVPQNYDKEFKGTVSVRTALASSLNVPAVRTFTLVGANTFYERLKRLGYQSLNESSEFYGYSLALGSADVNLWDQVNAYRTLANGGVWTEPTLQTYKERDQPKRIFTRQAAFIISDILADRAARGVTFGLENSLTTRFWTAVKTGTSKNMRDNWCIGYSRKYTVGVWVGNFDGEPMWNVSGMSGAAPVWHELMNYLHAGRSSNKPVPPPQLIQAKVDFGQIGEPSRQEWFIKRTETNNIVATGVSITRSRILYPAIGTVIAMDSDIPADRQAVFFEIEGADGNFELMLDGRLYSNGESLTMWHPIPGKHVLALNSNGISLDFVEFIVRPGGTELAANSGNCLKSAC